MKYPSGEGLPTPGPGPMGDSDFPGPSSAGSAPSQTQPPIQELPSYLLIMLIDYMDAYTFHTGSVTKMDWYLVKPTWTWIGCSPHCISVNLIFHYHIPFEIWRKSRLPYQDLVLEALKEFMNFYCRKYLHTECA